MHVISFLNEPFCISTTPKSELILWSYLRFCLDGSLSSGLSPWRKGGHAKGIGNRRTPLDCLGPFRRFQRGTKVIWMRFQHVLASCCRQKRRWCFATGRPRWRFCRGRTMYGQTILTACQRVSDSMQELACKLTRSLFNIPRSRNQVTKIRMTPPSQKR
jgi:hypothetical protein